MITPRDMKIKELLGIQISSREDRIASPAIKPT